MSDKLLYSIIDESNAPAYRQSEIVPGSLMAYDEAGEIAAKSHLEILDIENLQDELDKKAPTLTSFYVDSAPYNAVGDGVTDDTAAIQSCIDAAIAAGGGVIEFSAKTYLINTLSVLDGMAQNLSIRGNHPEMVLILRSAGGRLYTTNANPGTMVFVRAIFKQIAIEGLSFERSDALLGNGPSWLALTVKSYDTSTEIESVDLVNCRFINAGRTLSITGQGRAASGKLKLVRVTGCEFVHPYGSGQSDPGGGADDCLVSDWVDTFLFDGNYFDGCVGGQIDPDSFVTHPKDGFLMGGARNNIITNSTFRNFWVEGLNFNPSVRLGFTAPAATVTIPDVGSNVTFQMNLDSSFDAVDPGELLFIYATPTTGANFFIGSVISYNTSTNSLIVENLGIDGSAPLGTVLSGSAGVWVNKYADMLKFSAVVTNNVFNGTRMTKGEQVWGGTPAISVTIPFAVRISNNTFAGCRSDISFSSAGRSRQPCIISQNRFERPDVVVDYNASSTVNSVAIYPYVDNVSVIGNTFIFPNNAYQGGIAIWSSDCVVSENTFITNDPTTETGGSRCFALNISDSGLTSVGDNMTRNTRISNNRINGLSGFLYPNTSHETAEGTKGFLADGTPADNAWTSFLTVPEQIQPFKPTENGWWTVAETKEHFGIGGLLAHIQIYCTDAFIDFQASALRYAGPSTLPIVLNMSNQRVTPAVSAVRVLGGPPYASAIQVKVADYTRFTNNYSLAKLRSLPQGTNLSFAASRKITNIAAGNPAVLTCADHGLATGETVYISDSNSSPNVNGGRTVTVVDEDTFTIPVNVASAGTTAEMFPGTYTYASTLQAGGDGVKSSAGFGVIQGPSIAGVVAEFPGQMFRNSSDSRWAIANNTGGAFEYLQPYNTKLAAIASGSGLQGTTSIGNAPGGYVGEVVSSTVAQGSAISLTSSTPVNVCSITLGAGDWDVTGNAIFSGSSATVTGLSTDITATSASISHDGTEGASGLQTSAASFLQSVSPAKARINVAASTTVYLTGEGVFSAGTVSVYGAIFARRVR